MKRLLILCLVVMSFVSVAELRYDASADKWYSKGSPKDLDQNEYNDLVLEVLHFCNGKFFFDLTEIELLKLFALLRFIGTPPAYRLIYDLEQLIKDAKRDIQRFKNL